MEKYRKQIFLTLMNMTIISIHYNEMDLSELQSKYHKNKIMIAHDLNEEWVADRKCHPVHKINF